MSGGSHGYLCFHVEDELASLADRLWKMGKALKANGCPDMATRTMSMTGVLHGLRLQAKEMAALWKAQEWNDSGDWSVEQVRYEADKLGESK